MSFPDKIFDKTKVNYVQKCAYVLNLIKNKNESIWLKFKVQFESLKPEESYEFYNTLVHEYQILLSDKPGEVGVDKLVPAIITKKVKTVKFDDTIKKVEVGKEVGKAAVELKAPVKKEAVKKAPVKKAVKKAPVKKAVAKKAPVKKAVVKKAPVKKAVVKKAPVKKAVAKKAPVKKAAVKKAPVKKAAAKKAPVKKAPAKKAVVKKTKKK